jgi:hypothetical protein
MHIVEQVILELKSKLHLTTALKIVLLAFLLSMIGWEMSIHKGEGKIVSVLN